MNGSQLLWISAACPLLLDCPANAMMANLRADENWQRAGTIALGAVLCYLLFFNQLGAIGLVGPDEPRFAQVARETAEQNNWITPMLYGAPWFEKPMLYYWLAAIAYKIGGVNETTARLPSALAAAVTVVVFSALAWELYGWLAARLCFLLLGGSLGWFGFARAASTDMLFSASLNVALAFLVLTRASPEEESRQRATYGFHAALGLALLAKGPAALVLAGGPILLYVVLTKERGFIRRLLHPGPVALLIAVSAPWYVLVTALNGWAFVDTFILAHNIERFLTPVFRHERGPWFFFAVLPLAVFPWTVLLGAPVRRLWQERRRIRLAPSAELLLVLWIAVPLVFFTLSRSKLPGYILPAVPALCLLLVGEMAKEQEQPRLRWWLLGATASALLAAIASPLILTAVSLPLAHSRAYRVELALAVLSLCAIAWLAWKRRLLAWALAMTALTALLLGATNCFLSEEINQHFSARPIAQQLVAKTPAVLPSIYAFQVSRQLIYGLNYYLRRPLPDAATGALPEETAYVLLPAAKIAEARKRLSRELQVVEQLDGGLVLVRATTALPAAGP